jgi:hypothetical protein
MSAWLLLLLCGLFLLLPVALQFLIALKHRRERRGYSVLDALDHLSKLAGSFSLVLAVIVLLYGAFTQRASERFSTLLNRQAKQYDLRATQHPSLGQGTIYSQVLAAATSESASCTRE